MIFMHVVFFFKPICSKETARSSYTYVFYKFRTHCNYTCVSNVYHMVQTSRSKGNQATLEFLSRMKTATSD